MCCVYSLLFCRAFIHRLERYERTWDVVSTRAVARSLANKRKHVRTVQPGSVDDAEHRKVPKIPV